MELKVGDLIEYSGRCDEPGYNEEEGTGRIISNGDQRNTWNIKMVISKRNYIAHIERLSLSSVMGDRGDRRRSRLSTDVHSPFTSSSSVASTDSKKSRNSGIKSAVVAAVSRRSSSRASPVAAPSRRNTKSPVRKESPLPPSQSPVPAYPQSDILKQQEEQRFTDENGTIYPRLGDKIKVLFDEKDWYSGSVQDFNIETKIVAVVFDEGGEFEMIDFPDEDLVIITETGHTQRNGGNPLNPTLSENDLNMEDFDRDYSSLIGLQYAENYFLYGGMLVEYWCTVSNVKVVKGKDMCDCLWTDGTVTEVPVQSAVDHINLNRANERRGRNGAAAYSKSGRSVRARIPLRDVSNANTSNNLKNVEKTEKVVKTEKSSKINTSVSNSKIDKNSKINDKKPLSRSNGVKNTRNSTALSGPSDINEYVEPVIRKRSIQSDKFEMNKKSKNSKIVDIKEVEETSKSQKLTPKKSGIEDYSPIGGLTLLIGDYSKNGFESLGGAGGQISHSKESGSKRAREEGFNTIATFEAIFGKDLIYSLPGLTISTHAESKSSPPNRPEPPSGHPPSSQHTSVKSHVSLYAINMKKYLSICTHKCVCTCIYTYSILCICIHTYTYIHRHI
jgi:hypothetical protein